MSTYINTSVFVCLFVFVFLSAPAVICLFSLLFRFPPLTLDICTVTRLKPIKILNSNEISTRRWYKPIKRYIFCQHIYPCEGVCMCGWVYLCSACSLRWNGTQAALFMCISKRVNIAGCRRGRGGREKRKESSSEKWWNYLYKQTWYIPTWQTVKRRQKTDMRCLCMCGWVGVCAFVE